MLTHTEVCGLLELYFQKVVELRVAGGEGRRVQRELEVKLEEERERERRAEAMVRQVELEGERSLMTQQMVKILLPLYYRETCIIMVTTPNF